MESFDTEQSAGLPSGALVGRRRELAALLGAFDAALDHNGSLILLAGEPGIGKTTLADALAAHAREHGAVTVWGRAWDTGGSPAFWPWRQIVRRLSEELTDAELLADNGPAARWLVGIAPELDARIKGEDPVEPNESEQSRFAQFDALATFLRASASRAPLVVLLDDLHAFDMASLRALEFVATSVADAPVLLVATVQEAALRRRPEAVSLVASLERHGERITLVGLDADDVALLLASKSGSPVSAEVSQAVFERTDGNPLFAEEVGRELAARGGVGDGDIPLPDGVRAMIRERVAALGEDGKRILTSAAVIGHEFRIATLERVVGVDRATLLDLLDEADTLGIVVSAGGIGRFRFRHGLVRDTLYQELRATRRAEAHRDVGEALRDLQSEQEQERTLSELAHHFVAAAPLGDSGPAVEYSVRAGRQAMDVYAFEQAAEHFTAALRSLELGEQNDLVRARLLLDLGLAQDAFVHEDADATLLSAADLARSLGDNALLADVALAYGPYALSPGIVDEPWVRLTEEAIASIGDEDPRRRALLLARLGRALYFAPGMGDRRVALAEESVALARTVGDPATLAGVLSDAHAAIWRPDRVADCLEWIAELQLLQEQLGDPRGALPGMVRSIDLWLELGDVVAADMALGRLEVLAEELNDLRAATLVRLHRARQALVEGRFAEIPEMLNGAAQRASELRYSPVDIIVGGQMFCLRLLCGGIEEIEPQVRAYADGSGMPVWRAALARLYVELDRDAEAVRELDRMAADGFGSVEHDAQWLLTIALLAEVAWRTGRVEHGEVLRELLAPFEGRMLITTGGVFLGPVERVLGQLAALDGDLPGALTHLETARTRARSIGARPSVLLADADEAAIRLAAGDTEAGQALLTETIAGAESLDMGTVRARMVVLAAATGAPATAQPPRATPGPSGKGELVREGDTWVLRLDGRSARLRDAKGVHHLAVLLGNPGVEVHAVELVAGSGSAVAVEGIFEAGLSARADLGDAGALLDATAKREYAERIGDLRESIEEAERFNDPERAASAREELDALTTSLAGAVGLGGRDRVASSAAERARVNVTRAIRSTLRRIADHDAALGGELEAGIRTGTFCSYEPSPLHPVTWEVDDGRG